MRSCPLAPPARSLGFCRSVQPACARSSPWQAQRVLVSLVRFWSSYSLNGNFTAPTGCSCSLAPAHMLVELQAYTSLMTLPFRFGCTLARGQLASVSASRPGHLLPMATHLSRPHTWCYLSCSTCLEAWLVSSSQLALAVSPLMAESHASVAGWDLLI